MKTQNEFLDAAKKSCLAGTDAQLARMMGFSKQHLSMMRRGERFLTDEQCLWVAKKIGVDAAQVIAAIHIERTAGNKELRKVWERIAASAASVAAALPFFLNEAISQVCILCSIAPLRPPACK